MTLQEKMLAKQSKKGFTLVELVVVIAILAILAAIAIPAVVSIISSATVSQGQSDASTLNNAVKEFYSGVYSGSINATSYTTALSTALPAAGASATSREKVAATLTVADAQKYSGIAIDCEDMVFCTTAAKSVTVGTIMYKDDPLVKGGSVTTEEAQTNGIVFKKVGTTSENHYGTTNYNTLYALGFEGISNGNNG